MKRCYDSGASKRKRREHAINELSKQKNSLDAFVCRKHVHDDEENVDHDVAAVTFNVTANSDTEDKYDNSGHTQSSTNVNISIADNFLQAGTSSKPPSMISSNSSFLTEVDYHSDYYETQAEITETNAANTEFNLDLNFLCL
jgi:hypothetical protein